MCLELTGTLLVGSSSGGPLILRFSELLVGGIRDPQQDPDNLGPLFSEVHIWGDLCFCAPDCLPLPSIEGSGVPPSLLLSPFNFVCVFFCVFSTVLH